MEVVAALYVERRGIYSGRPDVELWDKSRDARRYGGPWRVVAHPPCERWGRYATVVGRQLGDDGGCFDAALRSVERWGGVLEHPAASSAWAAFGLPKPDASGGWSRTMFRPGWACQVDQGHYGHRAPKPTWLYVVGTPRALAWGPSSASGRIELMGGAERRRTPAPFAELLLALARSS